MNLDTNDFLNKNAFRSYPFRRDSDFVSSTGIQLPDSSIVDISASSVTGGETIYLTKFGKINNRVFVELRNNQNKSITFQIDAPKDYTTYFPSTTDYADYFYASVTLGIIAEIPEGIHSFSAVVVEDSLVYVYVRPAVLSISTEDTKAYGDIKLNLDNILANNTVQNIAFSVIDIDNILTRQDRSSSNDSCDTPVIKRINSVEPDENGNIDIYGIDPIVISVDSPNSTITMDMVGLTLEDYCELNAKNIPPLTEVSIYSNFATTDTPEYKSWSQYL